ncbi:hypothetical protein [Pseudomonas syringae]|uniref:hypothetical protein n=1 Tax=Pseudomonas syringae TaxID=317 RepID=UPI0032D949F1
MEDDVAPLKRRQDGKFHAEDVTANQLMAVMDTFTKTDHRCPVCTERQWRVQLEDDEKPVIAVLPTLAEPSYRVKTFFMSCAKCGFIRSHLAENICELASNLQ